MKKLFEHILKKKSSQIADAFEHTMAKMLTLQMKIFIMKHKFIISLPDNNSNIFICSCKILIFSV